MKNQKRAITYILERLQEPSTIRGMVLLAAAMGANISEESEMVFIEAGLLIAGLIAVMTPDKYKTKEIDVSRKPIGYMPRRSSGTTSRTSRASQEETDEYDIKG
jgi:uncharacterized membrane-anchored protein